MLSGIFRTKFQLHHIWHFGNEKLLQILSGFIHICNGNVFAIAKVRIFNLSSVKVQEFCHFVCFELERKIKMESDEW